MSLSVLLLGDGGMLAHDLVGEAPQNVKLERRSENELDITSDAVVREIARIRPDIILNAAAYTAVDRAETERDLAFAVNGDAVGRIGSAAAAIGSTVVHISTDYVFNGHSTQPYRETDDTGPLGIYGSSKLAGEIQLAGSGARHLIIRTQWLFGVHGNSFPRTMWDRAVSGQPTRVVDDQFGKPTFTADLAKAVWTLAQMVVAQDREQPHSGVGNRVVHVTNSGHATWYAVAKRVFEAAGVTDLLTPCKTSDYPTPAPRPRQSALDTGLFGRITGASLPHWEAAIDRFLAMLTPSISTFE